MSETCSRCEGTGLITIYDRSRDRMMPDDSGAAILWCGDCLGSGKSHPSERAPEVEWGDPEPAETPKP